MFQTVFRYATTSWSDVAELDRRGLKRQHDVIEGVITAVDGRLAFGRSLIFQTDWNRAVEIGPRGEGLSQRPAPPRATGRRQAGECGILR